MRYGRWIALLLVLLVLAGACGGDNEQQPGAANKEYLLGVAIPSSQSTFYVEMQKGIADQAKELGVTVRFTYADFDPAKQLEQIQGFTSQGMDGIIVGPLDANALVPAYEAARQDEIPIMSVADHVADRSLEDVFVGEDYSKFGVDIAQWICDETGGEGKLAMIKGPPGIAFVDELTAGFKDYLSSNCPGVEIIFEGVAANLAPAEGLKLANDALAANPDLTVFQTITDDVGSGVAQALAEKGLLGKVIVTGFDGNPDTVQALKEGTGVDMTIALKPYTWGRLALEKMVDLLNGENVPKTVGIESILIDKSNVDTLDLPADLR